MNESCVYSGDGGPIFRASPTPVPDNHAMELDSKRRKETLMPRSARIIVAAGWNEAEVARAAIAPFVPRLAGNETGTLVLAWGDAQVASNHKGVGEVVRHEFSAGYETIKSVNPSAIPLTGWIRSPRSRDPWAAVDVDDRSDRLRTAWLRRELVEASTLFAINRIPHGESDDPIILGLWARLAHPRQRLGALAGDDRTGLRAELATAVKPNLCILCGESRERPLIVATNDQIAADLTGRAIQYASNPDPFGERAGPWELPLIQRATELDLGVRLPSDLELDAVWAGEPGEPGERMLQATVESVRLALGIPSSLGLPESGHLDI